MEQGDNTAAKKALAVLFGGAAFVGVYFHTINDYEGRRNYGYLDPIGVVTACDGITGHGIKVGQYYSDEQCDAWFYSEALAKVGGVVQCTPVLKGRGYQLIASGSLAHNIGVAGFCRSSIAKLFRARQFKAACERFPLYNKAGGHVLKGLVRRRAKERVDCLKGAV